MYVLKLDVGGVIYHSALRITVMTLRNGTLKVLLWVTLSFVITMPGAIAFANWDAPYGFHKDLATWMSCASALLTTLLIYNVFRRKRLSGEDLLIAGFIVFAVLIGQMAQRNICGQMGYRCDILSFFLGGFAGLFLSLLLFPVVLWEVLTFGMYPYDRPLIIAWYLLLAVTLGIVAYMKRA